MKRQRFLFVLLVPLALASVLASCDSANPVAPQGTVLTVTANPLQIGLNGQSIITVTGFRPDGNPLFPGTQVLLSTDRGTLQPLDESVPGGVSVVEVDERGQAMARLLADGRTGEATVEASLTSGGDAGTASVTVQIGLSEENRPSLLISANPSEIAVQQTSRISLLGRNADNTPVGAGQRIRLTADLGTLRAPGVAESSTIAVFTDSDGEASATFVAGNRGGAGAVFATMGSSEEVSVGIDIRDAIASLFLSASKQTIQRLDAGDMVTFTAILQDATGEPVSGTIVNFESERGSFNNIAVASNSQGQATATLTVRRIDVQDLPENATFTVRATATAEGNTETDSVTLTILGAP